jgi:sec-independent protein translocase protein TatA
MLSIPDMAILGAAALLFFGPEQLPRVARKAGSVMREIQNTSQSFIREMERAADIQDAAEAKPPDPVAAYDPAPYDAAAYDEQTYDEAPAAAIPTMEPPAPDPDRPAGVAEKLAEPRPAPGPSEPVTPANGVPVSTSAETPPESDHPAHL